MTEMISNLDMIVEDEWQSWKEAVSCAKRDVPCVIRLDIGQSVKILLLKKTGLPKILTLHREDGILVPCTPSMGCPQCEAKLPRRTLTVLNVYEFEDRAVRLLVCEELLTIAIHSVISNRYSEVAKCPLALYNRHPSQYPTTRDHAYEVKILPELLPDTMEIIETLSPIDPATISDEVLVGGLF